MITKISKLEHFGILAVPKLDAAKPFNVFNVVYGWNGSGKTTLGRLLRCLETKCNHTEFPDAHYLIELENGSKIDSAAIEHDLQIRVFNQDFISENLNLFDAETKPIIFISKEKVQEKKELDQQKLELTKKVDHSKRTNAAKDEWEEKIDKCHKNAGKAVKDFLLGTTYANVTYNKATSRDRIWPGLSTIDSIKSCVLTDDELAKQKSYTISNSSKPVIELESLPAAIDSEKISEVSSEINLLLTTLVTSKAIDRLKEDARLSEWIAKGLLLHRDTNSKTCEFCGLIIPEDRLMALEDHFNEEFSKIVAAIVAMIERLNKGKRADLINRSHLLYEELTEKYETALSEVNAGAQVVNELLDVWIKELEAKKQNPFEAIKPIGVPFEVVDAYNDKLTALKSVVDEHNSISQSHDKLAKAAQRKIENHFVSQWATSEKLKESEIKASDIEVSIIQNKKDIASIKARIKELEDELKSDTIAIAEINNFLHRFLGRNDIVLERQNQGGYQLKRDGIVARNLSEGEKTAISLIYFFSKIRENDVLIKNLIIVLDDPISSFDSNHLFNASSFIKKYVEGCQQLFVLTHNFWFFKQVRDWMIKKNEKRNKEGQQIVVSHIYSVDRGHLKNAAAPLTRFHSEYQHVFNTVLDYQAAEAFDDASCYAIANAVRRLLEAFTSFKTPDNSGFNGALDLGVKKGLSDAQKERVHFFLNKYSHLDRIESFDNTVETLLDEGRNVVTDILWLIKTVDAEHYQSMLKICGKQDMLVEGAVSN